MKIDELLKTLEAEAGEPRTAQEFALRLPLRDAARLLALAEMYSGRTATQLAAKLLSVALDELEAAFPYVQGEAVVAEDDHGDPIYEDVGPTPRFIESTRRHLRRLERELAEGDESSRLQN